MRKFSITNYTSISKEYQEQSFIHSNDANRDDISLDIVGYVSQVVSQFTQKQIDLLNYIFWCDNNYINIWVSQDRIARHVGITREHVNRLLASFVQLGLIRSQNRGYMKTCILTVSEFFHSLKIRSHLRGIFSALAFVSFSNFVFGNGHWRKTHSNREITLFNNKSSSKVIISLENDMNHSFKLSDEVVFALANGLHLREVYYPSFINESINVPESIRQVICDSKRKTVQESPIRESIRGLKSLSLTKWGQIELMKFPDLAIQHAAKTLKLVSPRDPFIYFLKICNDYCKSNGIRPDYSLTQALLDKYKRPEKYSYTIPLISGAEFAGSVVNGFSAYSARSPQSAAQGQLPQRRILGSPDKPYFTMEEILARKAARQQKANAKLVACGKQPLPAAVNTDPFSMNDVERATYLGAIDRPLLNPLLKLGLNSPLIEHEKKLMIIKTMTDLNISLDDFITQYNLDKIIGSATMSHGAAPIDTINHDVAPS